MILLLLLLSDGGGIHLLFVKIIRIISCKFRVVLLFLFLVLAIDVNTFT
jgi:hypothetical protein